MRQVPPFKRKKQFVLKLLFLVIALRLVSPLLLSWIVNLPIIAQPLEQTIKNRLPYPIQYQSLGLEPTFTKGLVVHVNQLDLRNYPIQNQYALSLNEKNIQLAFNYLDLLQGKVTPKEVLLNKPHIKLTPYKVVITPIQPHPVIQKPSQSIVTNSTTPLPIIELPKITLYKATVEQSIQNHPIQSVFIQDLTLSGAKLPLETLSQKVYFKISGIQLFDKAKNNLTPWQDIAYETHITDPLKKMRLHQRAVNLDQIHFNLKKLDLRKLKTLYNALAIPIPQKLNQAKGQLQFIQAKWLNLDNTILVSLVVETGQKGLQFQHNNQQINLPKTQVRFNSQLHPELFPEPWIVLENAKIDAELGKGELITNGSLRFPYRFLRKNITKDFNEIVYDATLQARHFRIQELLPIIKVAMPNSPWLANSLSGKLNADATIKHDSFKPLQYQVSGKLNDVHLKDRFNPKLFIVKNLDLLFNTSDKNAWQITQLKSSVPSIQNAQFYGTQNQLKAFHFKANHLALNSIDRLLQQYLLSLKPLANFDQLSGYGQISLSGITPSVDSPVVLSGDLKINHLNVQQQAKKLNAEVAISLSGKRGLGIEKVTLEPEKNSRLHLKSYLAPNYSPFYFNSQYQNLNLKNIFEIGQQLISSSTLLPNITLPSGIKGKGNGHISLVNTDPNEPTRYLTTQSWQNTQLPESLLSATIEQLNLKLINQDLGVFSSNGSVLSAHYQSQAKLQNKQLQGTAKFDIQNLAQVKKHLISLVPQANLIEKTQGGIQSQFSITGTLPEPKLSGTIALNQIGGCYQPTSGVCISDLSGSLNLSNNTLETLSPLKAKLLNSPIEISGRFSKTQQQWQLKGKGLSISNLHQTLKTLPSFNQLANIPFHLTSGTLNLDLDFNKATPTSGFIEFNQFKGEYLPNKLPLTIAKGRWDIQNKQLTIPNIMVDNLPLQANGNIQNANAYDVKLSGQNIAVEKLIALGKKLSPEFVPNYLNPKGQISFNLLAKPNNYQLLTQLKDAGLSLAALPFPVDQANGELVINLQKNQPTVSTSGISYRYANSPMHMVLKGQPLTASGELKTQGTFSPLLLNYWLKGLNADEPFYLKLPYQFNLSRQSKNQGAIHADFTSWFIPSTTQDIGAAKTIEHYSNSTLPKLSAQLSWINNTILLDDILFSIDPENKIEARVQRESDDLLTQQQLTTEFKTTKDFPLETLYHAIPIRLLEGLSGKLNTDIKVNVDEIGHLAANGELKITDAASKTLAIQDTSAWIELAGQALKWHVYHFKIPGADVAFEAETPDINIRPIALSHFNLTGKEMIVSLYTEWFTTNFRKNFLNHPMVLALFPPRKNQVLGFEIPEGTIALDEIVVNNIIVNNLKADLQLFATSVMDFNNITADVASGTLSGNATFTPKDDNYIRAHLLFKDMQANAVARALLGVNNQVFGRLNGVVDFTTEGEDQIEWLSRANAYSQFNIQEGRLPAVTEIENKMILADTLAGGVFNLNLNSIFKVLQPIKPDYFADLNGTFQVSNGLLVTNDLRTTGRNFNLDIKGQVRLVDTEANLKVKGSVNKKVKGILGGIGSFSIGRIFNFFPPLQKLISWIPGIGFIPGLGRKTANSGLAFELDVIGPAGDPNALQNFRWAKQ